MSKKPKKKLTSDKAKAVLQEMRKRQQRQAALDAEAVLFGPQKKFAKSQKRLLAACCSRRAGKTYALAFLLLSEAMRYPRSYCIYVTMAREEAKRILWPALMDFDDMCHIGLEFKQNTGEVHLPNGSIILLAGAGSMREVEKGRGKKYPIVVIDEAQVFSRSIFDYMINEVYEPATVDYLGRIVVTGTPNSSCAGPFYDICTGRQEGWDVHNWTILDNPFQPQPIEDELSRIRERRGWTEQHPGFRREYMGQWIRDENDLVFQVGQHNLVDKSEVLPRLQQFAADTQYVLGIDVGFKDPMGFCVLAYSTLTGKCTVVETHKEEGLIPSVGAKYITEFCEKYPITSIVVDTQGIGKGYAEEWDQKFGFNITIAKKGEKASYVEFLNGDLRTGAVEIVREGNEELFEEMSMLQWDPAKRQRGKFDYHRGYADHLADAFLYGWRECYHHRLENQQVSKAPARGSQAYWDQLEEELLETALNPPKEQAWYKKC